MGQAECIYAEIYLRRSPSGIKIQGEFTPFDGGLILNFAEWRITLKTLTGDLLHNRLLKFDSWQDMR